MVETEQSGSGNGENGERVAAERDETCHSVSRRISPSDWYIDEPLMVHVSDLFQQQTPFSLPVQQII